MSGSCFRKTIVFCIALISLIGSKELYSQTGKFPAAFIPTHVQARLNGTFSVNQNGAAEYKIPIAVPPGTAGARPDLEIAYNSQTGNGLLGTGFNIAGLPAITRTGATRGRDGFVSGVNYDSADRFSLDGNRLVRMDKGADAYFSSGAYYMTEQQTWTKVIAIGQAGNGPYSFKCLLKNGTIEQYGDSGQSQVPAKGSSLTDSLITGSVRTWLISKSTDCHGNTIRYTYRNAPLSLNGGTLAGSSNNSTAYPDAIFYSGKANTATQEKRKVQFYYEPRSDTLLSYQGGASISSYLRLKAIRTFVIEGKDTSTVSTLLFKYDSLSPQGVSRLSCIYKTGMKGDSSAPIVFSWTDGGFLLTPANQPWYGPAQSLGGYIADINRDGKTDLLPVRNNTLDSIYLAVTTGFEAEAMSQPILVNGTTYLADYNGDGFPDLLVARGNSGRIYYGNGNGFNTQYATVNSLLINPNCNACTWAADFNGDGRADLLTISGSMGSLYLGDSINLKPAINLPGMSMRNGQAWVADFNGDGQADFFTSSPSGGSLYLSDFSRSGNWKTPIPTPAMTISNTASNNLVADFNADGLADILCHTNNQYSLYLSNGKGFESAQQLSSVELKIAQNWLSDFNGDGNMDFYAISGDSASVYFFYGNRISQKKMPSFALQSLGTWSGDYNGDGIADLYSATTNTMYFGGGKDAAMPSSHNQVPHLLVKIDNGIGGVVSVSYQPMTDKHIYSPGRSTFPNAIEGLSIQNNISAYPLSPVQASLYPGVPVQTSLYLVEKYAVFDGRDNTYTYRFQYSGSLNDLNGYGWLGFASQMVTDSSAQNITTRNFLQAFPFSGRNLSISRTDLSGKELSLEWNGYQVRNKKGFNGSSVYSVMQTGERNNFYENGAFAFTTGTDFLYDDYDNISRESILNDTAEPKHRLFIHTQYINDEARWHFGLQKSSIQSADSTGVQALQKTSWIYDTLTYDVLQLNKWLNTDNSWLTHAYHYDSYGNKDLQVNESGDTTRFFYDPIYHSFIDSTRSPANAQGQYLVTKSVFEPAFGNMVESCDANGNRFTVGLDQFGQDSLRTGPGKNGKQVVLSRLLYLPAGKFGYIQYSLTRRSWDIDIWDTVTRSFDGINRQIKKTWSGSDQKQVSILKEYNSHNQATQYTLPFYAGQLKKWIRIKYDPNQRKQTVTYPVSGNDSVTTRYVYAPKKMTICNAWGTRDSSTSIQQMVYANNQLLLKSNKDAGGLLTQYQYDLLGRLITATDPSGLSSTITYNSLSDTIALQNPAAGTQKISYNYRARSNSLLRPSGDSITVVYDALHRKIKSTGKSGSYFFYYDLPGYQNSKGNLSLVLVNDTTTSYKFDYDAYGQISNSALRAAGKWFSQSYEYGADQWPLKAINPDSSEIYYSYYNNGFLKNISEKGPSSKLVPIVNFDSFDAGGNIELTRYGNGVLRRAGYEPLGMLSKYELKASDGTPLISQKLSWNRLSRLTGIYDSLLPVNSQKFHYQANGQLDTASGPYGMLFYNYDSAGNPIQKDSLSFTYTNYQLSSASRNKQLLFTQSYDLNGNRNKVTTYLNGDSSIKKYHFDSWNQLTAISQGVDTLFRFTYNMTGRRLSKTDVKNGLTTWYVSPQFEYTQGQDISQNTSYVVTPSQRIAAFTKNLVRPGGKTSAGNARLLDTGTVFFHADFINNTQLSTGQNGKINWQATYKPFGQTLSATQSNKIRYQFGGKELDESGLYYFNARYYDPVTGRYITADDRIGGALTQSGIYNRYGYVLNIPTQFGDPSGHILTDVLINIALGIVDIAVDAATEGAATPALAEIDEAVVSAEASQEVGANFLRALNESRAGGRVDNSALRSAYKIRREIVAGGNIASRETPVGAVSLEARVGEDQFGNSIFSNTSSKEIGWEKASRDKLLVDPKNPAVWTADLDNIGKQLETGERFKFTISARDFTLRIGSDDLTHAAIEGEGGPVYTAGSVVKNGDGLIVNNVTGHYKTNFQSLKMSEPFWNILKSNGLDFSNITYTRR